MKKIFPQVPSVALPTQHLTQFLALLLFLALPLLASAQKYEPSTLKPGDYIINSRVDGSLVVIDGGLRDDGIVDKDLRAIKDRVVGIVAAVKGGQAIVIDLKDCPAKKAFSVVESKDKTFQGSAIIPKKWAHERSNQTHLDMRIPTVAEAESFHYEAIQHSLQQLIDAGREDVALVHGGSDYWTIDYSRPDYPKAYAWYHYKGRIKTHLREPTAKLFLRTVFSFRPKK